VQLRLKEAIEEDFIRHARELKKVCLEQGAKLIINDRVEIAKSIEADGVHLGRGDMKPKKARELLGKKAIIGATANSLEEVMALKDQPIDYIGIGPYRGTQTKEKLSAIMGPDRKSVV